MRISIYDKCIHDNDKPYVQARQLCEREVLKKALFTEEKVPFIISHQALLLKLQFPIFVVKYMYA